MITQTALLQIQTRPISEKEKKECLRTINVCESELAKSPRPTGFFGKFLDSFGTAGQFREAREIALKENKEILARGIFETMRCQPKGVIVLEEFEDEGTYYIFDVDDHTLLYLGGQDFPTSKSFPNTDFEIVKGTCEIVKHGKKLKVSEVVKHLEHPDLVKPACFFTIPGELDSALDDYQQFLENMNIEQLYEMGWG